MSPGHHLAALATRHRGAFALIRHPEVESGTGYSGSPGQTMFNRYHIWFSAQSAMSIAVCWYGWSASPGSIRTVSCAVI